MAPRAARPSLADDLRMGARFLAGLPSFLRHPLDADQARAMLAQRRTRRDADFLALLRDGVFANPGSPYRWLLAHAGCEPGDLGHLVARAGLEGALAALARAGVYLTVDELKGRRPVTRGSATTLVEPAGLLNPRATPQLPVRTGGRGGQPTIVPIDLDFVRDCAVVSCLVLGARGGLGWTKANWGVPGGGALAKVLEWSAFGAPVARWFSQLDPGSPGLHPRYRWSARLMRATSLLAGRPLPAPEHVAPSDPAPLLGWLRDTRRAGGTPHLFTFATSALRLAEAAEAGDGLEGVRLTVVGEPLTAGRRDRLRRAGADPLPRYATTESGLLGYGCLAPAAADDMHRLADAAALIQAGPALAGSGLPPAALLVTALRPTAPLILLNASMGDQGDLASRSCGCPLEAMGWTGHLRDVRSFEKVTSGGMNLLDADVERVLDELLPTRLGGRPGDFQLWEAETAGGRPCLTLVVDPALGTLDERAAVEHFLSALERVSDTARLTAMLWRAAGLVRVVRAAPVPTPSGKLPRVRRGRVGVAQAPTE